jgi:hypothetical protein
MKSIPMLAVNQTTEQEARYRFKSPLLFGVLSDLDPEIQCGILDLTPANFNLVEFFNHYRCKLHLPGCRDEILKLAPETTDSRATLRLLKRCIPLRASDKGTLDILLLWDLANYLKEQTLAALISYLTPYFSEHAIVHAYIHTHQTMPTYPGEYRLSQDNHVIIDNHSSGTMSSPMYYQELLHKVLAPFRVDRGMLLANGLQEYILRI